ncbi:MAG TPA: hypothetical protein VFB57_02295 [Gaiellaceae bacterium]|jgi:hypothetical protein|nr:hypothetical protein [Gaiellaceae bacterium]
MDRFNALGRGAQIMLVGAILLLIDLFLPWQDFDVGGIADELGVDATWSGWHGFAGVVLGLLTIIVLAWCIVRLASVDIPLPVSTAMTAALLGTLVLIFAIIKMLSILGDEQTIWAWIGLVLAIVIAVGAFQTVQEAGGVDTLRTEASSLGSSSAQTAPAATTPPPPPPAATPEAAPPPAADMGSEAAPPPDTPEQSDRDL